MNMVSRASFMPGPSLSTRDKLKQNARYLFAERGISGVTVRDILNAAGEKNGASLNYYFGSKDDLIREIVTDVFILCDQRWGQGLAELESRPERAEVRDYIRVLATASDTSDMEEIPTAARLIHAFSHQNLKLVTDVLKEHRLQSYDRILAQIAARLQHFPPHILRQRLILLTRYFSTVSSLYESVRVSGSARQRQTLGVGYDVGNLVDTAVGLLTADVIDADPLDH